MVSSNLKVVRGQYGKSRIVVSPVRRRVEATLFGVHCCHMAFQVEAEVACVRAKVTVVDFAILIMELHVLHKDGPRLEGTITHRTNE